MEAEETIINYETYDAIRGYGAPCAYSLMKPYLEHQAEISFKAGTLQAYGIAGVMGKKNSEDSYKAGIQEGRREVVDWLERYKKIKVPKYQLKEWGIEPKEA